MNHFTRLIELTSADEEYVSKLATSLAPCILRPRAETSLTMEEKHAYRLVRDLFAHKDAIFSELKRMSTLNHSGSVSSNTGNRPRAISTDESNRKAHMEERTRALLEKASGSRSRATSPAPSPRGHRRERSSVGGPETRFPISTGVASPTQPERHHRQSLGPVLPKRTSLEVPGDDPSAHTNTGAAGVAAASSGAAPAGEEAGFGGLSHPDDGGNFMNGFGAKFGPPLSEASNSQAYHTQAQAAGQEQLSYAAMRAGADNDNSIEKRNSLGRSGARFVGGRRVAPSHIASAQLGQDPSLGASHSEESPANN